MNGSNLVAGKVAIVTGAGSGIGLATARLLAAEGASGLMLCDLSVADVNEAARGISALGCPVISQEVDVSDAAQVEAVFAATLREWGRVDCLVNNAGVSGPQQPLGQYNDEQWRLVIGVNLDGVFYCMRAATTTMVAQGSGSIVNVASGAAVHPPPGLAPYAASKSALIGLTRSAAGDYAATGIRINAVLPGPTRTRLWDANLVGDKEEAVRRREAKLPMGRVGQANEVAEAIVWLCSDRASYVHGVDLLVDGGAHAFQL